MRNQKTFSFAVKDASGVQGRFTGRASVYGVVDSYNDVVMPGAFVNTLKAAGGQIVVLDQHDPTKPIGKAQLTDKFDGLWAEGQLEMRLPAAKEMAIRLESGLIDGISIGYEVLDEAYSGGVRQLKEIKLWEISLVTFPANSFARVTDVKQSGDGDASDVSVTDVARLGQLVRDMCTTFGHKAGRVLSSENRALLERVHGGITGALDELRGLIDATNPELAAIDQEGQKLVNAAKRLGANDPAVRAFAVNLSQRIRRETHAQKLAIADRTFRLTRR